MFKTAEVTVTYVPDVEDQVELVGLVEIEGDGDESNNVTEPYTVNVLPEACRRTMFSLQMKIQ